MISEELIAKARAVLIEDELDRRGIQLRGRVERCGPCPKCGGTDRFSINTIKQTWNCRQCKPVTISGDVIGFVQWLDDLDFAAAVQMLTGRIRTNVGARIAGRKSVTDEYAQRQHQKAAWLWLRRRPIEGSPAERYLREIRRIGTTLPPALAYLAPVTRQQHPALMTAFGIPEEAEPGVLAPPRAVDAVHLTLLRRDGNGKADVPNPKIIVGRPLGRPIVLAPPNDLGGLAVVEGLEDGLSIHESTGLGAWAAGSAGMMPALGTSIPKYVEALTIFAHRDRAGEDGALGLAASLEHRDIEVRIEGLA